MVSSIFYVHPYLGKWSKFDRYFSDGLKPPTRGNVSWFFQGCVLVYDNIHGWHHGSWGMLSWWRVSSERNTFRVDFFLGMNFRSSYDCAWSDGQISISGWWFQICLFSPLLEEMIQLDWYFSDGLKPPTRYIYIYICICICICIYRPSLLPNRLLGYFVDRLSWYKNMFHFFGGMF